MFIPARPLHNETQRHVARMATRDDGHIKDLDLLIRGLHKEGLWGKIRSICVVAPAEADSLLDLKGNQDSVKIGSPAFVANRGFTTVSTTAIINTQVAFSYADAFSMGMSVYVRAAHPVGDNTMMGEFYRSGGIDYPLYMAASSATSVQNRMRIYAGTAVTTAGGGFRGVFLGSTEIVTVGDEVSAAGAVSYTTWTPSDTHYSLLVGARNGSGGANNPSVNQYAHWSVTDYLDSSEARAYDNLIKDYMTARGAAV